MKKIVKLVFNIGYNSSPKYLEENFSIKKETPKYIVTDTIRIAKMDFDRLLVKHTGEVGRYEIHSYSYLENIESTKNKIKNYISQKIERDYSNISLAKNKLSEI